MVERAEHDRIFLEPFVAGSTEDRTWCADDVWDGIADEPGVPFLLATPKRLAADDLYAACEEAASRLRYSGDLFHDQGQQPQAEADWAAADACNAALSKARSEPLPLQSVK